MRCATLVVFGGLLAVGQTALSTPQNDLPNQQADQTQPNQPQPNQPQPNRPAKQTKDKPNSGGQRADARNAEGSSDPRVVRKEERMRERDREIDRMMNRRKK